MQCGNAKGKGYKRVGVQKAVVAGTRKLEMKGGGGQVISQVIPTLCGTIGVSNVNNNSTSESVVEINCCSVILKEVEGMVKRRCRPGGCVGGLHGAV